MAYQATPFRMPGEIGNKYGQGMISGALSEAIEPLIVLGDNGSEVDDVLVLQFIGVEITEDSNNVAVIDLTGIGGSNLEVTGSGFGGGDATQVNELNFEDMIVSQSGANSADVRAVGIIVDGNYGPNQSDCNLIYFPGATVSHYSNVYSNRGVEVQVFPTVSPSGTFILAAVNGNLTWLSTTTC